MASSPVSDTDMDVVKRRISIHLENEKNHVLDNTYMDKQSEITCEMRELITDWIVNIHSKFRMISPTLALTVNILDRFLSKRDVPKARLAPIACAALFIAGKYAELFSSPASTLVRITNNSFTCEQLLAMECIILHVIGYHLTVPTSFTFLPLFCKLAQIHQNTDEPYFTIACYFQELALQNYECISFRPSEVAASAVYLACMICHTYGGDASASVKSLKADEFANLVGYEENQLKPVLVVMLKVIHLQETGTSQLTAVRRKYLLSRFGETIQALVCPTPPCMSS